MPVSLSTSFLIVRVDSRFCPPISYSHFQVPTGSALASAARARPLRPNITAAARIAFMIHPPQGGPDRVYRPSGRSPQPLRPILGGVGRRGLQARRPRRGNSLRARGRDRGAGTALEPADPADEE